LPKRRKGDSAATETSVAMFRDAERRSGMPRRRSAMAAARLGREIWCLEKVLCVRHVRVRERERERRRDKRRKGFSARCRTTAASPQEEEERQGAGAKRRISLTSKQRPS
jgi:hypothetical protein